MQRCLEAHVSEELTNGNNTFTLGAYSYHRCTKRQHSSGMIVGGIGMGNIATHRGPVSHYRIGYHTRGIREDRIAITDERRAVKFRLAGQCADAQLTIRLLDVLQAINAVDVDQDRRVSQAETQKGDEALAPGQNFGFVSMLFQKGNSFWNAVCHQVIKRTRNQSITSK